MIRGIFTSVSLSFMGLIFLSVGIMTAVVPKNVAMAQTNEPGGVTRLANFDIITLDYRVYEKDTMGPVQFNHKSHAWDYQVYCGECHHDYKDGKNIYSAWGKTQKCMECHDPLKTQEKAMKLMTSYHRNCKICHQERDVFKGEARAYKKCDKCHLGSIMIENEGYKKDKTGPVKFEHRKHEKTYLNLEDKRISCKECHHEYVEGKNIWKEGDTVKRCGSVDCHDPLKKKGEKQYKLRIAYHKRCKECHKAIIKAGKKKPHEAPYTNCTKCMKTK